MSLTSFSSSSFTRSTLLIMVRSASAICLQRQETQHCVYLSNEHATEKMCHILYSFSLFSPTQKKNVTSHLCVGVFMGGSGQCMPNSNRSWALFSLEVKTQTRTKNAAWVMQLVFLQCICSTTLHSCWKRQTERRPGRKDKRAARVQSTES